MKRASMKYVMASVTGLILSFAIMYWRGITLAETTQEIMQAVSDGFFVVGFLYVAFGLLFVAAHAGTLDIITYGFRSVIWLFTPFAKNRDEGGYYEYKMKKKEKRKGVPYFLIWVGLVFVALSVLFLVLYYKA